MWWDYKEAGMSYGNPYTTFDRHNGLSLQQTIQSIRNRIYKELALTQEKDRSVFKAYQAIYINAIEG